MIERFLFGSHTNKVLLPCQTVHQRGIHVQVIEYAELQPLGNCTLVAKGSGLHSR